MLKDNQEFNNLEEFYALLNAGIKKGVITFWSGANNLHTIYYSDTYTKYNLLYKDDGKVSIKFIKEGKLDEHGLEIE